MNIQKTIAFAAILSASLPGHAEVLDITGTLDGSTSVGATLPSTTTNNPATPAMTGTFDDTSGAYTFNIANYSVDVVVGPGTGSESNANISQSGGMVSGADGFVNGHSVAVSGTSSCTPGTGPLAGLICSTPPPTGTTGVIAWNSTSQSGTLTTTVDAGPGGIITTNYSFAASSGTPVPPPTGPAPADPNAIPTMSFYGLALTMLGLVLVANQRLRRNRGSKK